MQNREIQYIIPQTSEQRNEITAKVAAWLDNLNIIPPVNFERLFELAGEYICDNPSEQELVAYIMIQLNNQLWQPWIKAVPVEKRLLLLPRCLASSKECQGTMDHVGLICNHCQRCDISGIEKKAQEMGYVSLIAEGSPIVAELIKTGQISGIIGVSCLEALRKAFDHINNAAIPAIAVPLLVDGCEDTRVDLEQLEAALKIEYSADNKLADHIQIKEQVQSWFEYERLMSILTDNKIPLTGSTASNSIEYAAGNGKRYRPFITAAVYEAITGDSVFPKELIQTSIAIEFFHKASLIHDDIEDNDSERYGEPTLNARFGSAYAINAGDFLIGTGYSLLANLTVEPEIKGKLIAEIASAHQMLTIGQGMELENNGKQLPLETVLEIFKAKTSPAFAAALKCGAYLANAEAEVYDILEKLSSLLGIAYQIKDDLDDINTDGGELSILDCFGEMTDSQKIAETEKLLEEYLEQCRELLDEIKQPQLKFLLTKIVARVTNNQLIS